MTKDEFKRLRERSGYTHGALAEAMGVHLRTIWRWELGEIIIPKVVELAMIYLAEQSERKRDAADLKQAKASLKEARRKGRTSWPRIKKDLGLTPRMKNKRL